MVKGKLILICQSGGEFLTNDDGLLSYEGGEANAITINPETLFDDLMLKLAELLNFDHKSLSVKYFLPGNKRTLITLSNDKDLKRMYDFHGDAVTAEVFVTGKVGFDREAFTTPGGRANGIKLAETVPAYTVSQAAGTTSVSTPADDSDSDEPSDADCTPNSPVTGNADGTPDSPIAFDMSGTPADTVKKRRRAATKNSANGARKRIKTVAKRKNVRKRHQSAVVDYEPQGDSAALLHDFNESPENMVASWKDGITGVGQEFQSVHEFRDALQKYAVAHRFMYRLKKNEKSRASGTCMVEGCPWRIYASWVPSEEVFRIKKMNVTHTCGGDSRRGATPTRNWLVSILKAKLRENPHCKPKEVADTILRDFGIELNYTQVWRGIGDAKQQLQGSYKEAYNLLPLFCDNLLEANPGSVAKLSIADDKKFRNLFVCFDTSIYGFENGCRPLLFLDSTSLKSKHREILLTANALDGDDGVFPVAFAIIDIENGDNWLWFLEQLRSVLTTSQSITFVTDRQKELMNSVLKVFENAHHGYSIFHLLDDFMINLKGPFHGPGKNSLPANFLAAAQAARLDGFRMSMEKIKRVSPKAYEWLMEIEPDYWTNAAFKGESYHQISFDIAGSYANWIEEVGDLPLIRKLETIQCKIMELINKRHIDSAWWSTKLTPHKEEKLKEETHKARYLRVLFSSDTIFEVHNDSINVVDMDKQECSCLEWKATGLPCRHAIAVFNCTKRNVYDYCSQYFSVDSYRVAYSKSINPFAAVSAAKDTPAKGKTKPEDARVLPPGKSPLSSQQKRKRNRDGLIERTVTCTKCLGVGHNKVSCKANS